MMNLSKIHFELSERKILLRLFDLVFITISLFFVSSAFKFDYFEIGKENWVWLLLLVGYVSVFGSIFELYDLQKSSKLETVISSVFLTTSVTVLFFLLTPYLTPSLPENRLQILYFFLAIILPLFLWRTIYINFISAPRFYKNVLLVGEISTIETIIEAFKRSDPNYKIVGFINCETTHEDSVRYKGIPEHTPVEMRNVIKKENISEVVVATYNSETITQGIYSDLMLLLESGFPIREYTQVYEDISYRVPVQFVGKDFYKYFPFSRNNKNKLYLAYRRFFDILISIIGMFFSFIFLPLVLIGNLLGNRGPLFYSQERVGKNGKTFKILKYRSMVINAEANGAVWAKKNDARVTTFGRFLRSSRLDELPQFINILKGDMSIIGPRPERSMFVRELSQIIPFYETRHIVKPGLTGWAQVKARYGATIDDSLVKLQYDLYYIKHRGFFLDFSIILKTLSTVIFFRGQ